LTLLAIQLDCPAVLINDTMNNCEAQSEAVVFSGRGIVFLLEGLEHTGDVSACNANSSVLNYNVDTLDMCIICDSQLDMTLHGELEGVEDQMI